MAAQSEQEEFEFRARAEAEAKAQPAVSDYQEEPSYHPYSQDQASNPDFIPMPNPNRRSKEFSSKEMLRGGAASKDQQLRYYTDLLSKKYGAEEGTKRILSSPEGKIMIKGPTGKWQEVGAGLGSEDLVGAIPAAAETIGGVAAALPAALTSLPSGPGTIPVTIAAETAGAAGGRYLGEQLRGAVGRQVNPDYAETPAQTSVTAKDEAAESALWALGGGVAFEVVKTAKGLLRGFGPAIGARDAQDLLKNSKEYMDAVAAVEARNVSMGVQTPMTPQLGNKHGGLAMSYPENRAAELQRRTDTFDSLESFMNPPSQAVPGVTGEVGKGGPAGYLGEAGAGPDMALSLQRQGIVDPAEAELKQAERRLKTASDKLAQTPRMVETAPLVSGLVKEQMEAAKTLKDVSYSNYEKAIGQEAGTYTSKHKVPVSIDLLALKKDLQNLSKKGLQLPNAAALLGSIKKGGKIDLAVLDDNIKELNSRLYAHRQGLAPLEFGDLKTSKILDSLKTMRDDYIDQYPQIREALDKAQANNAIYQETYRTGFVEKLVRENGKGEFVLTDPGMVTTILTSGNGEAINQLASIAKTHPGLQLELQRLALAHYRSKVMPNGSSVIDAAAHNDYMSDAGWFDKIAPFFSDKEKNLIRVQGGLAQTVLSKEKNLVNAQNQWDKILDGKAKRMDVKSPESFVKNVFTTGEGKLSGGQTAYLMNQIKKFAPDQLDAFKAGTRQRLISLVRKGDGDINLSRLNTILGESGENLKAILGADYVKDLGTVQTILQNEARVARISGIKQGVALEENAGVARKFVFGQLSPTGYRSSLFAGLRSKSRAGQVYEAMTNPEALKKWITYYNKRSLKSLGVMGVSLLTEGAYDND